MYKSFPDSYCNTCKRHSAVPPFSFRDEDFSSVQVVSSVVIGNKPIFPSIVCSSKPSIVYSSLSRQYLPSSLTHTRYSCPSKPIR